MIGKITGKFVGQYNGIAIIEVGNEQSSVGYEVAMKSSDAGCLTENETVSVFIKEIIKEDDNTLYGFTSFEEKCWFEEMIKLSGLGPKIALSILSTYSCEEITEAIFSNNCEFFSSISGIGAKLANRIPVEMKKQIEKINQKIMEFGGNAVVSRAVPIKSKQKTVKNGHPAQRTLQFEDNKKTKKTQNTLAINDAVETLKNLGFTSQEVYKEVFKIAKNSDCTTEEIVKEFLKKK